MIRLNKLRVPVLAALALMLPGLLGATALGTLDITGVGLVQVTGSTIDFSPFGGGVGNFAVTAGTGDYSVLSLLATGEIADLADPPDTAGPPLAAPVNPFMIVPDPGAIFSFNLEQILLGGGAPCPPPPAIGSNCTPTIVPNSPFLLTQNANSVGVSFSVRGTVTDLRDDSQAYYNGLFTANLTGSNVNTVTKVLTALDPETGPGYVVSSWSASFTSTPIPEPATLALIGGGLVALVAFGRRRKSRT